MIEAVVHHELLLGGRRNRLFWVRLIYGLWLILQVGLLYLVDFLFERYLPRVAFAVPSSAIPETPESAPQVVGALFSERFLKQHFILLAIATPALVAGAITDEKRRGTLQYLLLTQMETRSLVLGKLVGRSAQVGRLALVGLPLFALLGAFGGIEPLTFLAFFAVSTLMVLAIASAALLASVWCRQTRDAVLALYGFGIAGAILTWQFGGVLEGFDPLRVLEPLGFIGVEELGRRLVLATLCWGTVGGICLALAVWRLKPAYLRELEGSPRRKGAWYPGRRAPVNDEPVRWRERNVEGLAPMASLRRVPQWLAVAILFLFATASSLGILALAAVPGTSPNDVFDALRHFDLAKLEQTFPGATEGFLAQGAVILLLASLVVGIRCSGAVTGERERQTWEALLLSPLTTRDLVYGKLWGVMGASYIYLFACGLPAVTLAIVAGRLAVFWAVLWLAVTVLAMYFIGAVGLWASVGSKSSWQALLWTLGCGYLGGAFVNLLFSVITYAVLMLVVLFLALIDERLHTGLARTFAANLAQSTNLFLIAISLSLAISSWLLARYLVLQRAQTLISQRERTRHWRTVPIYRRAKHRPRRVAR
jgi:ABC-type transport system involved in multi-copper enzyme maturation permease subunit